MLQKKSLCVCELQEILGIAQSNVSRHLKILEDADLVEHEKNGQWVDYKINTSEAGAYASAMLIHLRSWIENHAEIQKDREQIKTVNRNDIYRKAKC